MSRKSTKTADEMVLATFRINAGTWHRFQDWARQQGNTATGIIVQSIHQYLDESCIDNLLHLDKQDIDEVEVSNIDKPSVYIDNDGVDIDGLTHQLAQRVTLALEDGRLDQRLKLAVDFALDDQFKRSESLIEQHRQALDKYDATIQDASRHATDTATAFIDSQIEAAIEKAIAPIQQALEVTRSQMATAQSDIYKLQIARDRLQASSEENADRWHHLAGKLAESLAVNERLGGGVQRLEAALFEHDSKIDAAGKRASETATAFIDSQIEKALASHRNAVSLLEVRVTQLEAANAELIVRNRELMAKLAEVSSTTCTCSTEVYYPDTVIPADNTADNTVVTAVIPADNNQAEVITSDDNEPQSVDHVDQALVDQTPVGDTITTQEEETINERIEELQRELAELPPEGEDEDEDEDESVACEREALQGELDDLNNQLANSEVVNTAPVVELPDEENEVASDSVQNPPSVEASAPVAEVLLPVPEVKPVNPRCKAAPLATPTTKTDGLTQTQLAARLNVSQGTVSRQSKSGAYAFSQWSQTQDPEGVAWQLQGKLYFRKGAK